MPAGTIRLKATDLADRDQAERQTVIGEMGYQYHFGPNETKVLADNAENRTLSANATVTLGSTVQQSVAPKVNIDSDGLEAIT
jgi:hypothetical protein